MTGNTANQGAGIYLAAGAVTLRKSLITANVAALSGGGIFRADGSLVLTNSSVTGNSPDDCIGC